jgi:hypothetical protein
MHWKLHTCIFFILVPLRILDHGRKEPEELTELALAEETNPELTEGKPRRIPLISIDFYFNHRFMLSMCAHLVCRGWLMP